jgi:iron complex outermembrane recepter protein
MNFSKKLIILITVLLQVITFDIVFAQEGNIQNKSNDNNKRITHDGPVKMEEVIVSGSRFQKTPSAMPNTVTIIDNETLQKSTAINMNMSSVLERNVPGFGPSLEKLVGRGETFRGRNPLYLIDGVPQFNPLRDGQRDGQSIDMDMVERIEVIHGSNSMQGIGATGGVINIVTKQANPDGKLHNDAKLGFTTHDSFDSEGFNYKGTYNGSIDTGVIDFTFGLTAHQRGIFFDGNGDAVGLYRTQGDIMDSLSYNIFFKTGFEPKEGHRFQVTVNYRDLEGDADYKPVDGDRSTGLLTTSVKGDPTDTVGDPTFTENTLINVDYTAKDIFGWDLRSQFYYQDFHSRFGGGTFGTFFQLTVDGDAFLDQSQIDSEKMGFKFAVTNEEIFTKDLDLTLGLDIALDESQQSLARSGRNWVPLTEQTELAPFMQADYELFKDFSLTGGFRLEDVTLNLDTYTTIASSNAVTVDGGDPSFSEVLPNIGAIYDFTDNLSLYSNYTKGFTLPDVGRVLRAVNTTGQDVDSLINLEPVITDNLEFGAKYNNGIFNAEAAFYTSNSDLGSILRVNSGGSFEVDREYIEIMGFDISAGYQFNDRLKVGANYAHIYAEYDSDGDGEVDSDLDGLNVAPNRLNFYADMNPTSKVNFRLSGSHLFSLTFDGDQVKPANFNEAITLFDLFTSMNSDYGILNIGIQNLFDNQYVTYFGQVETNQRADTFFAGRGRTLTFQLSKSF